MREVVFVLAQGQNHFFEELVGAVGRELASIGVESRVSRGAFPEPEGDEAFVLVPPHEWYWIESQTGEPDTSLFPRTVFFCTEQPGTSHFDDNVNLAERAAAVVDINRRSVREFNRRNVAAEHFQLGYHAEWDVTGAGLERDLDVAFMGCATERRLEHLGSYGELLWPWRTRFVVSDNAQPNRAGTPGFLTDHDKLQLLARARILLNIHQSAEPYFEWLRVIEATSNGCLVLSEHSTDFAPLIAGGHVMFGEARNLGHLAVELLEDEPRRAALAAQARTFLQDELPLRNAVERLAERAAEAVKRPLPARAAGVLGSRASGVRSATLIADDETPRLQPHDTTHDPSLSVLKAGVKALRLDLMDARRSAARDRKERLEPEAPLGTIVRAATPTWTLARPRVSVLVTLYNYADFIQAALDSVARCGFRSLEMIVVDDASTDDSADRVLDWITANPALPTILLGTGINRGLPRARNAALSFARGEHAFILDADNEIYPGSLDRLVGALDEDPEAAFAYGLIERVSADGPAGLMGWQAWNPKQLRVENYIDAMALVRTSVLRSVGGYTVSRDLHGWEDYDLWCNLAERGYHGAHVMEIVARYRASSTSMLTLTNLSSTVAYAELAERYPRLMEALEPPL